MFLDGVLYKRGFSSPSFDVLEEKKLLIFSARSMKVFVVTTWRTCINVECTEARVLLAYLEKRMPLSLYENVINANIFPPFKGNHLKN